MSAIWLWTRADLRNRWRSWVVLGLLAGVTFGLAAAGVAGARRTEDALPRLIATGVPHAAVLPNDPAFDAAQRQRSRRPTRGEQDISLRRAVRARSARAAQRRERIDPDDSGVRKGRERAGRGTIRGPRPRRRGGRQRELAATSRARPGVDDDRRPVDTGRGPRPLPRRSRARRKRRLPRAPSRGRRDEGCGRRDGLVPVECLLRQVRRSSGGRREHVRDPEERRSRLQPVPGRRPARGRPPRARRARVRHPRTAEDGEHHRRRTRRAPPLLARGDLRWRGARRRRPRRSGPEPRC